jgi:hypothetical protein
MEISYLICSLWTPFQPDLSVHNQADDISLFKVTVSSTLLSQGSVLSLHLPEWSSHIPHTLFLEAPSSLSLALQLLVVHSLSVSNSILLGPSTSGPCPAQTQPLDLFSFICSSLPPWAHYLLWIQKISIVTTLFLHVVFPVLLQLWRTAASDCNLRLPSSVSSRLLPQYMSKTELLLLQYAQPCDLLFPCLSPS